MNNVDLIRTAVIDAATLCGFLYHGRRGNIDPGYIPGRSDSFLLWFDGKEQIVYGFNAVLDTPFFDGKPLRSIANELTGIDW